MNYSITSKIILFLLLSFSFQSTSLSAQDCECNIDQVLNNTVEPCDYTIGSTDTVYTTEQLRNAITFVNANNANIERTILIADGTYPIATTSWYPYITASNVVFRSLSGNRDACILTGQGMRDVNPETENGIFAVGDNITIANLTLKELGNHAIQVTGNNLYVFNVKIQNTYEQMIKASVDPNGNSNGRVKCSLMEYTAGIGPNWYIGGLDIHQGSGWVVSDNVFKNIASPADLVAEHAVHFWDESSDNIVERNQIINCDRGIGFGLGSSPNTGGIIRNNMIYNNGGHPFNDVGIGLETSPGTQVYNNTIHVFFQNAIEFRFEETNDVQIINNLCNKPITSRNGGMATLNKNLTNASNDLFANLNDGDLRLSGVNGNIVDQGSNVVSPVFDIDKTNRPQGSRIDIGAHEWMQSVSTSDPKIESSFTASPNPFIDQLEISGLNNKMYKVTIYNQNHRTLFEKNIQGSVLKIKTEDWARGFYNCRLIEVKNPKNIEWIKLVKVGH